LLHQRQDDCHGLIVDMERYLGIYSVSLAHLTEFHWKLHLKSLSIPSSQTCGPRHFFNRHMANARHATLSSSFQPGSRTWSVS